MFQNKDVCVFLKHHQGLLEKFVFLVFCLACMPKFIDQTAGIVSEEKEILSCRIQIRFPLARVTMLSMVIPFQLCLDEFSL